MHTHIHTYTHTFVCTPGHKGVDTQLFIYSYTTLITELTQGSLQSPGPESPGAGTQAPAALLTQRNHGQNPAEQGGAYLLVVERQNEGVRADPYVRQSCSYLLTHTHTHTHTHSV